VITGIIKANIPTRISFKVASRINSQIILDETGAESLLGNGDCLFLAPGTSQLARAQGAYISDEDINRVIKVLTEQAEPNYLIPSFDTFRPLEDREETEPKGKDSLYDQALTIVLSSKNASTTYLQRKLKIGYARAASLMDELEENGIISPQDGAKPRRVIGAGQLAPLASEDDFDELS
jgi:S-DNA-T family DNA segregation ATPase FtsK/SpoIIIE